jgi:hypothetical protein
MGESPLNESLGSVLGELKQAGIDVLAAFDCPGLGRAAEWLNKAERMRRRLIGGQEVANEEEEPDGTEVQGDQLPASAGSVGPATARVDSRARDGGEEVPGRGD